MIMSRNSEPILSSLAFWKRSMKRMSLRTCGNAGYALHFQSVMRV